MIFEAEDTLNSTAPCVVLCPGYHGHGIARSMGRAGVSVYGVHADQKSPSAQSRYWHRNFFWDFSRPASRFLEFLLEIARQIAGAPILIPTDDHSSVFVADHAELLRQKYLFPEQPKGLVRALSNKEKLYYLCKQCSISTPETIFPKSRADVLDFARNGKFPAMLKGIDTVALLKRCGKRMVPVNDGDELLRLYDEMANPDEPNLMIQELIPGAAENVWMFNGYFDHDSNCLFGITGRKLRQYPAYTGLTSLGICEENSAVAELTKNFVKQIGYKGILDIGFKYNSMDGKYYLLDPNPRIGSTFRLFVDNLGIDVVLALYRDLTGQKIRTGELQDGRKWFVEPFDVISSLRYWRDGNLTIVEWLRSFRGIQEAQWFALDDLLPFITMWVRSVQWSLGILQQKSL